MIEWKKMSEEQPKEDGEYLVYSEDNVWCAEWERKDWYMWGNITHWAEINKPEE